MSAIISRQNYNPTQLLTKVHVLIVNQNSQVSALIKNILAALGFTQSYCAEDAVEAIRYMREIKINIVITDSQLRATHPDFTRKSDAIQWLSGADFVKRLRQSPTSPNPYVSVVIMANTMSEQDAIKARDAGVNGVVLRPLEAEQLSQSIREIVEAPRRFVVSESYKGPCRRKRQLPLAMADRRRVDILIVKNK